MKYLKFIWLVLTGRYTAVKRPSWVTAEAPSGLYLTTTEDQIPAGYVVVLRHTDIDAVARYMTS